MREYRENQKKLGKKICSFYSYYDDDIIIMIFKCNASSAVAVVVA